MWRVLAITTALSSSMIGSPSVSQDMSTWADVRSGCVIRQQYDFSCGLASLATILQYEFGLKTSERDLLHEVLALTQDATHAPSRLVRNRARTACGPQVSFSDGASRNALLENGASLLQLWCLARMHGVEAFVREADPEFLIRNLDRPIVVHLTIDNDLEHFAVLRKIDGRWVHLADPRRGCKVYLLTSFLKEWQTRQVLILHNENNYTPLTGRLLPEISRDGIERLRSLANR